MTNEPVLPPLTADEWGPDEYDAFGALLGVPGDQVPRAGSGHRFDPLGFEVIGVMANNPGLAGTFLAYNGYLLQRASLSDRLRELVVLRVAHRTRCAYEWSEHVRSAEAAGVSDEEIERLGAGNEGFDGTDLVALEATDELLESGRLAPASWGRLRDAIGVRAAMDLLFTVGTYQMLASAIATWGLTPGDDATSLPTE